MNETINKFLSLSIKSKDVKVFSDNQKIVDEFKKKLTQLEKKIKSFDGFNDRDYNEIISKFDELKNEYKEIENLLSNNQEFLGKMRTLENIIQNLKDLRDFSVTLNKLKKKLSSPIDLDEIIDEFERIKTFYDANYDKLKKNETVTSLFDYLLEMVSYIKANYDYLKEFVEDAKKLSINDDNYLEVYEKYSKHKAKLESICDDLYISMVDEIIFILSAYPTAYESSINLYDKVKFLLERIEKDDWSATNYLNTLKKNKVTFQGEYDVINLKSKPYIHSDAYNKCYVIINDLDKKIKEVDLAINAQRKLRSLYDDVINATDSDDVQTKLDKLNEEYVSFEHAKHFPAFDSMVKNLKEEINEALQDRIVKDFEKVEKSIHKGLAVSTLKSKKNKLKTLYASLDSEHKKEVKYEATILKIDTIIKKYNYALKHNSTEVLYLLAILVCVVGLVGFYFYNKFAGTKPLIWLFENPHYFYHKWNSWVMMPWKWVEQTNVKDFWSFLWIIVVFIAAVISMVVLLIAELLWIVIVFIAFIVLWLVFTILSFVLHLLMYAFPVVIVFIGILILRKVASEAKGRSPKLSYFWFVISLLVMLGLAVVSYLIKFGVIRL